MPSLNRSDARKLRILAAWLDRLDTRGYWGPDPSQEVQEDLRDIALKIEKLGSSDTLTPDRGHNRLPKKFVEKLLDDAKHLYFWGIPIKDLTRDELIASLTFKCQRIDVILSEYRRLYEFLTSLHKK